MQTIKQTSVKMSLLCYLNSVLICLACLVVTSEAFADQPLWEMGGGLIYVNMRSYPGSHHTKSYLLPTPIFHYNGKYLKIDQDSVSTPIFKSDRIHVKLSADGTPPVDSSDIEIRDQMPDLDATLQMGPSIEFRLDRNLQQPRRWTFKLPLRLSIATDLSHVDDRGWLLNPKLRYQRQITSRSSNPLSSSPISSIALDFRFTLATLFANRRYLEYYYGVEPAFATSDRPSYQPASGYAGSYVSMAISQHWGSWKWSAYTRVKWLKGSKFETSPLIETNQEKQFGLLISYTFARSLQRVPD